MSMTIRAARAGSSLREIDEAKQQTEHLQIPELVVEAGLDSHQPHVRA
jgi:hypothetical protein